MHNSTHCGIYLHGTYIAYIYSLSLKLQARLVLELPMMIEVSIDQRKGGKDSNMGKYFGQQVVQGKGEKSRHGKQ